MIDSATGMKPGTCYRVDNLERVHQFPGFFLDGRYYLGPELLTAVGWLEGQQFIYDNVDATGEPMFPDRVAGTVHALTLTLVDGTQLALLEAPVLAEADATEDWPATPRGLHALMPGVLLAGTVLLFAGCVVALSRRRRP